MAVELRSWRKNIKILIGVPAIVTYALLVITTNANDILALQYTNYTNQKYGIQFEYPSTWILNESKNTVGEGHAIKIYRGNSEVGFIGVRVFDDLMRGLGSTNLRSAVNTGFDLMTREFRVKGSPSFITMDGRDAGTFLFMNGDNETSLISQLWITIVGHHGYTFDFIAPKDRSYTEDFDSPDNVGIRDHFIKSVKFLGVNQTSTNSTNGFD